MNNGNRAPLEFIDRGMRVLLHADGSIEVRQYPANGLIERYASGWEAWQDYDRQPSPDCPLYAAIRETWRKKYVPVDPPDVQPGVQPEVQPDVVVAPAAQATPHRKAGSGTKSKSASGVRQKARTPSKARKK